MLDEYYMHEQQPVARSSKRTRRGSGSGAVHAALQATGGTSSAQAGSSTCAAPPARGGAASPAQQQQQAAQHEGHGMATSINEKEARKQARMIRNRNAAQASRDRKKEHTAWLEARVAQLEAQLSLPSSMSPSAAAAPSPAVLASTRHSSGQAGSYQREVSESPSMTPAADPVIVSDPADAQRITELEDENETLRARLQAEQDETTRLRKRLETLEDKFVRLEQFMSAPLSTAAPDPTASLPSPSSFSSLSDTLPYVPFDSAMTGQYKREHDTHTNDDHLMFGPINDPGLAEAATDTAVTERSDSVADSSRLVAREVEDSSLPRKLDSVTSSGDEHAGEFFPMDQLSVPSSPPSPSSCASVELQHLDPFTVKAAWSDWAHGLSTISPNDMSGPVKMEDDELAGEFLDMTYLDGSSTHEAAAASYTHFFSSQFSHIQ
ncbi:X-box-binding protein 1 [Microbotryomycetes sp. JL201]|nr:X-box-binding protein 1 [Microbotryomycetes sp. JL201]